MLLIICVRMLTYYYVCLRMVTCACMHGIAHAQFCSRPRVVAIIPGTLTADGGRYSEEVFQNTSTAETCVRILLG